MAKPVRVGDEAAQRRRVEAPSSCREKQRVLGAARERGPAHVDVARNQRRGLFAQRHDAVLAAFALAHVDELLLEVHVPEIEPDCFRAAQSGRVDELDERAVPEPQRAFGGE